MKLMANHTVDCKWCGEDIRAMGTSSVAAHEARCAKNPAYKTVLEPWQKALLPIIESLKKGHKLTWDTRRQHKSNLFHAHREALRAKYGAPRTSHAGGMLREYFEVEDGKVIMFCSPENKDGNN